MNNLLGAAALALSGTEALAQDEKVPRTLEIPWVCFTVNENNDTIISCPNEKFLPDLEYSEQGNVIVTQTGFTANILVEIIGQTYKIKQGEDFIRTHDLFGDGSMETYNKLTEDLNSVVSNMVYGIVDGQYDCTIDREGNSGKCTNEVVLPYPYSLPKGEFIDSYRLELYKDGFQSMEADRVTSSSKVYTIQNNPVF